MTEHNEGEPLYCVTCSHSGGDHAPTGPTTIFGKSLASPDNPEGRIREACTVTGCTCRKLKVPPAPPPTAAERARWRNLCRSIVEDFFFD